VTAGWGRRWLPAAVALLLLPAAAALAGEDYAFMPKGGKALLLEVLGAPPDLGAFRAIALARRTEAGWREALAKRTAALTERQRDTLVAYLAVNLPLPAGAVKAVVDAGGVAAALPPDGRELAWNGCQACHSLFASHLTQVRDLQGWRNMFLSPFHRELKLGEREREEFARYSAINMPMRIEDVPQDLRF